MELILGGAFQGKLSYVLSLYNLSKESVSNGETDSFPQILKRPVLNKFHLYIYQLFKKGLDFTQIEKIVFSILEKSPNILIIANELGCGIVPIDPFDREYREITGHILCLIAKYAKKVHRVFCGIGTIIKESDFLTLTFIRHFATKGNLEKRYIGVTDESICPEYRKKYRLFKSPYAQTIVASPMKRCLETAKLLYPNKVPIIYNDLQECNFGIFEGKNYNHLKILPSYQEWLKTGEIKQFPEGESFLDFQNRTNIAFEKIIEEFFKQKISAAAFIIHGGSIMSILSKYSYPHRDFYDWHVENGKGYIIFLDKNQWRCGQKELYLKKEL